jgi:hypothetical protein
VRTSCTISATCASRWAARSRRSATHTSTMARHTTPATKTPAKYITLRPVGHEMNVLIQGLVLQPRHVALTHLVSPSSVTGKPRLGVMPLSRARPHSPSPVHSALSDSNTCWKRLVRLTMPSSSAYACSSSRPSTGVAAPDRCCGETSPSESKLSP